MRDSLRAFSFAQAVLDNLVHSVSGRLSKIRIIQFKFWEQSLYIQQETD